MLQTFVYIVVMKEFTNDLSSVDFPAFSNTQSIPWEKNYTLVDSQIHDEPNEPKFYSVCRCINKQC